MLYIAFQKGPSGLNPTKGCNLWSANWFATFGSPTGSHPLAVQLVRDRWRIGSDPDSGAGSPTDFATVGGSGPVWFGSGSGSDHTLKPDSKRTRPGREPELTQTQTQTRARARPGSGSGAGRPAAAAAASGGARARTYVHSSLLFARENSKYPKGTPFVLIFLYLYPIGFHHTANVGINACSYL